MRVLLTGASGFLGNSIIPLLLDRGISTTALDLVPPGKSNCQFLRCDLTDREDLAAALAGKTFDSVIHLAGTRGSITRMTRLNVQGTSLLIETLAGRCRSLVLASSCSVYGIPASPSGMVVETDNTDPVTEYGLSMLEKERIAESLCRRGGIMLSTARLFNLFGPGQGPEMMVPAVAEGLSEILSGKASPPLRTGPLSTKRDLIDVEDAASALVRMAVAEVPGVFNVGTGVPMSGRDVVDALQEEMGTSFAVEEGLRGENDIPVICADISRIFETLGWRPEKDFRSTVRAVVEGLHLKG